MRFPLNIFVGSVLGLGLGLGVRALTRDDVPPVPVPPIAQSDSAKKVEGAANVVGNGAPVLPPMSGPIPGEPRTVAKSEKVWLTGYVVSGRKVNVVLSDGRTYTERDPEMKKLERNSVTIDGEKFYMWVPEKRERPKPTWEEPALRIGAPVGVGVIQDAVFEDSRVDAEKRSVSEGFPSKQGSAPRSVEPEAKTSSRES